MSAIYGNWERLVAAVLKKEELWQLFHAQSESPSILSTASSFHLQELPPNLVLLSYFNRAFDLEFECVCRTSAKFLGEGTFGCTYSVAMGNGITIAMKRQQSGLVSESDFKRHMNIVGDVRHENVATLHAYYSSRKERILLYDYYTEGSVYALLHGQTGGNLAQMDWDTRVRIAIGSARGIAHIHAQNHRELFHGNIKSTNIFLNPRKFGCVSDLGLATMTEATFTPAALCYAPEVKNGKNVSQASDVYNFGILLFELLTRKSCVHVPGGLEAIDLVKLVSSSKSKQRAAKVFDADLLQDPIIRADMVEMLQIGIKCVAKSVKKRPKMIDVLEMLEAIFGINAGSSESRTHNLVFLEDANAAFGLEDVLSADAEVLWEGVFGTFYKTKIGNGDMVVVNRLRDGVDVPLEEFHQHMELFGRMEHQNLAALMAYYYSNDEKFMVYHYCNWDSVSTLLHGKTDPNEVRLDWKTRIEIAVGSAKGIAHIHGYAGQRLVNGSITSSTILFDKLNRRSIVFDFGLPKLMKPVRISSLPYHAGGFHAPEVKDTRDMSQASDVYSFGVFLLELATGWIPLKPRLNDDGFSMVTWVKSSAKSEWVTLEGFDGELLRYENNEPMLGFLEIARHCVEDDPEDRPRMVEVVKMLEEIRRMEAIVSKDPLEDRGPELSIESRLECLLEDLLLNL